MAGLYAALACLILGPFAPWAAHLVKAHGRGKSSPGSWLLLIVSFVTVYAVLGLAPFRWEWTTGLYLFLSAVSFAVFLRSGAMNSFRSGWRTNEKVPAAWGESLALGALTVYPASFGYGLLHDIADLRVFSIHLPVAVYTQALIFSLRMGTPAALLLAFLIRRARLRPGMDLILYLYGGVLAMAVWISAWDRVHRFALYLAGIRSAEPLLFGVYREMAFRATVHGIFYAGGIFLGACYLATATGGRSFLRRAVFLGLPTALGTLNFILLLGQGGYFLDGLRGHFYGAGHYRAFRAVAEIETARLPRALNTPAVMLDLAELASLQGRGEEAAHWRSRILEATEGKPYFSALRERVSWEEKQLAMHPDCVSGDSMSLLKVPRARPGLTLDGNWYGLLSAVSFFRPGWSDFDVKKKLLEVSPDIQLSVPSLEGVPSVAEALDAFGIPFSTCFLDSLGLHDALRQKKIPFLNIEGRWTPVVGWDPCRRGFLCYRYPDSLGGNPWFNPADKDAVLGGGVGGKTDSIEKAGDIPYNLILFLPERDVLRHLHEIGGVAFILGDSLFASGSERRAAYLTEYGDVLYQEHDDDEGAARAYARAQALYPSDYILARMAYLERRAAWVEGPDYGLDAIFREDIRKRGLVTGMSGADRRRITDRILNGEMGQYLLLNWQEASSRFFAGRDSLTRDSARAIFRTWLRLRPDNPVAMDSLASGFQAQAKWDSAETWYRRELEYYPLGNEYAAYRLAWVLFKRGRFGELDDWLRRCDSFQNEARYLLLKGAADWESGHRRDALSGLEKSLKLDKTIPETHAWLERVAAAEGDSVNAALHRRWRERTTP